MLKRLSLLLLTGVLVLAAGGVQGATLNVGGGGFYPNIQAAITAAVSGQDEVVIADGTYTGVGNVNLDFGGKAITVRSVSGPAGVIIDCENTAGQRGVYFQGGETSGAILQGITIRNGNHDYGGAIRIANASSPTIRNCVLENNTATQGGGAVNVFGAGSNPLFIDCVISGNLNDSTNGAGGGLRITGSSNVTIRNCTIDGNQTTDTGTVSGNGGGITVNGGTLNITGSVISNNYAAYNGGAIAVDFADSAATIEGCRIFGNTADWQGGALRFSRTTLALNVVNCLIYDNSAVYNGGVVDSYQAAPTLTNCTITRNAVTVAAGRALFHAHWQGELPVVNPADIVVVNSIIYDNIAAQMIEIDEPTNASVTISWSDLDDAAIAAANNNIDADPLFVDAAADNFRLQINSPAIDAGDNSAVPADTLDLDSDMDTAEPVPYDLFGAVRFFDIASVIDTGSGTAPIVDMGAYEKTISSGGGSGGGGGGGGGGGCFISSIMDW